MRLHGGRDLRKALIQEGLCPPNCRNAEMHAPTFGPIFIRYDVFLDTTELPKLIRALRTLIDPPQEGSAP